MPKLTRFADIPPFTRSGDWECNYGLDRLVAWVDEQKVEAGLNLDPDFQRGHVWTTRQQVKFIEFLLRGSDLVRGDRCQPFGFLQLVHHRPDIV